MNLQRMKTKRNSSPLSVLAHAAAPQLMLSKIRSSRSLPVIAAARRGRTKKWSLPIKEIPKMFGESASNLTKEEGAAEAK
ncbi:hypothetical protein ACFX2I_030934 [Malus domestica]